MPLRGTQISTKFTIFIVNFSLNKKKHENFHSTELRLYLLEPFLWLLLEFNKIIVHFLHCSVFILHRPRNIRWKVYTCRPQSRTLTLHRIKLIAAVLLRFGEEWIFIIIWTLMLLAIKLWRGGWLFIVCIILWWLL